MDRFTAAYIETALWLSTDENDVDLNVNFGIDDLSPDALRTIVNECASFRAENAELIDAACERRDYNEELAGYDFWLTRNGHGVGYWARELDEVGDALTDRATAAGERYLYLGDDGRIHYGS